MKTTINNFCKNFEESLVKVFNGGTTDNSLSYYNYNLGQKETSLSVRSMINKSNEKDYIDNLKAMQEDLKTKMDKENSNLEKQYYAGGINFINYILREVE